MRLIDADALTRHKQLEAMGNGKYEDVEVVYANDIDNAPTIDAVPRWIPCEERLPKDLEVVNITWVNHRPMTYYADIKDKPFTATAIHYKDKWWWYSPICEDLLAECGESECDEMDADIEVTAWMPLPEPYEGEKKMRLIDADALVKALNESGVPYRADVQEVLDAQPTADAVPVVRCKDCFLYGECQAAKFYGDDGYCSCGERKDDDED